MLKISVSDPLTIFCSCHSHQMKMRSLDGMRENCFDIYFVRFIRNACKFEGSDRERKKKELQPTHTHTRSINCNEYIFFLMILHTITIYLIIFFFLHEALYVDFNQNYWASRMIGRRISCRRILSFSLLNNSIIRFELLNNYLKTDGGSLGSLRKNAFES